MAQVLTFTANPALDVFTHIERVSPTHKMRCDAPIQHPGGGGVNVARVLHRFGASVTAVYPSGGVVGERHHRMLHAEGVRSHVVPIAASTRESFSVHEHASGDDFRFVLPGPELRPEEWQACLTYIETHWPKQFLVLSGGLAPGMPDDFYARLVRMGHQRQTPVVLDTNGPALTLGLQAQGVSLFKPSLRELRELTGQPLENDNQCIAAARQLIQQGQSHWIAVSLGADGALLVNADGAWRAPALQVTVRTTIGAGDSFVAGLVWAFMQGHAPDLALRWAMASSAAALLQPGTALCQPADVLRLLPEVQVQAL